MATTTLSSKNQIVVPKEVRERLSLKKGTRLSLYLLDDTRAVLVKEPSSPVRALKGLGKEVWQELGGADRYIQQERSQWDH